MIYGCEAIRFVSPEVAQPLPVGGVSRMAGTFYAHTKDNESPDRWQTPEDHLKQVAELTRSFADEFGAGDWGYLAGL
jgi:hypothetical protein